METKDKIEAIRQKCIEIQPSILDLVFGCEVMTKDGVRKLIGKGCLPTGFSGYEYTIGRPIRLADVLLMIDSIGGIEHVNDNLMLIIRVYWDLKNDSLDLQLNSTIDFIYSLLTAKEK